MSWRKFRSWGLGGLAWTVLSICVAFFVAIVFADDALVQKLLPGVFSDSYNGTRIGAAEYLAFVIGVPAALLTSIVAIIIASATNDHAEEQSLIQKIELLDKKFDTASDSYFRNVSIFEDFSEEIVRASYHYSFIERQRLRLDELDLEDPRRNELEQDVVKEDATFKKTFTNIMGLMKALDAKDDLFWKKAEQIHLANLCTWRRGFDYVTAPLMSAQYSSMLRPRDFIRRLVWFAEATTPDEFARLQKCLPGDGATALERAGALLWLVDSDDFFADFEVDSFSEGDEPLILFNVGASMLLAVVNALPNASAIKTTAELTFGPAVLSQKSYLSAIEVLREYRSDPFNQMIHRFNKQPWELIYRFNGSDDVTRLSKSEVERLSSLHEVEDVHSLSMLQIRRNSTKPNKLLAGSNIDLSNKEKLQEWNRKSAIAKKLSVH